MVIREEEEEEEEDIETLERKTMVISSQEKFHVKWCGEAYGLAIFKCKKTQNTEMRRHRDEEEEEDRPAERWRATSCIINMPSSYSRCQSTQEPTIA